MVRFRKCWVSLTPNYQQLSPTEPKERNWVQRAMLLMRTLGRVPQIEDQWDNASNTSSLNGIAKFQPQILFINNG